MLKDEYNDAKNQVTNAPTSPPQISPPPKIFKTSLFAKLAAAEATSQVKALEEVEDYLRLPLLEESDDPLCFWKFNWARFPILSHLAIRFLSFPATSGSVERLFSVAGAIGRARRARITTTNLEHLLCCRQQISKCEVKIEEETAIMEFETLSQASTSTTQSSQSLGITSDGTESESESNQSNDEN